MQVLIIFITWPNSAAGLATWKVVEVLQGQSDYREKHRVYIENIPSAGHCFL